MNRLIFICLITLSIFLFASDTLYLAILWHHHQPYYFNPKKDRFEMPWVRLHAIKDYYDMAKILTRYPGVEINFNLVPVLLRQIEMYIYDGKVDYLLSLHRKPISGLTQGERLYIIMRCFDINWENVIRSFPPYYNLLQKRESLKKKGISGLDLVKHFSDQELLDIQVWFNLAWIDPYFHRHNPWIRSLINKKGHFTFEEFQSLITFEYGIMQDIIPLYRRLMERGQIEISTTPFYHPILPILLNPDDVKTALPHQAMPDIGNFREEAIAQVKSAIDFYSSRFGCKPKGMWPAEGSVSMDALRVFSDNNIEWIATDEGILARTKGVYPKRINGYLNNPEVFCTPYRVKLSNDRSIFVIFRDTYLSDKIGFDYSGDTPEEAVDNLMGYLRDIYNKTKSKGRNFLVSIILDGENAWEHYPMDAHPFFEEFYSRISKAKWLKTTRISRFIEQNKRDIPIINSIWPGSWIGADFSTWIGELEENRAWEYIYKAKEAFVRYSIGIDASMKRRAYDELLAGLGSDWFWWYGNDQDSGNDGVFDMLYRTHLRNVYTLSGIFPPDYLDISIVSRGSKTVNIPTDRISIDVDGVYEMAWDKAGEWQISKGGVMQRDIPIRRFLFGFDNGYLYLGLYVKRPNNISIYLSSGKEPVVSKDGDFALSFLANYRLDINPISKGATLYSLPRDDRGLKIKVGIRDGFYELAIPLRHLLSNGDNSIKIGMLVADNSVLTRDYIVIKPPMGVTCIKAFKDPQGDDYGKGDVVYPKNGVFVRGSFDLRGFRILRDKRGKYYLGITLDTLTNPWHSRIGFSLQTIDIYLIRKKIREYAPLLPGRNAFVNNGYWEYCLRIEGWEPALFKVKDGQPVRIAGLNVELSHNNKEILVRIPDEYIRNIADYGFIVTVAGQDGYADEGMFRIRGVKKGISEWDFGGRDSRYDSNIIDILDPAGDQARQLNPVDNRVLLTPIYISGGNNG